jgi:hypothetical protein
MRLIERRGLDLSGRRISVYCGPSLARRLLSNCTCSRPNIYQYVQIEVVRVEAKAALQDIESRQRLDRCRVLMYRAIHAKIVAPSQGDSAIRDSTVWSLVLNVWLHVSLRASTGAMIGL